MICDFFICIINEPRLKSGRKTPGAGKGCVFQLEIGLGLAAFALLCLYDFIKTRGSKPWKTAAAPLFFAAVFLLLFATVRLVDFKRIFSAGQFLRQGLFFLSVSAFAGMFFALFFALPFSKTYIDRSAE